MSNYSRCDPVREKGEISMSSDKKGTNEGGVIPLKPGNHKGQHAELEHDPKWHDTRTNDGVHKIDPIPARGTH